MSEGVVIQGEAEETSQSPTVQDQRDEAQKTKARELGWTNKQEWTAAGKDIADWVSAREFLNRKSLFDKIHSQKNEIFQMRKEHQKELEEIKKYIAKMSDVEYKRAIADLNKQRREALQEGDIATADAVQEQIDTTKEAQKELKQGLEKPAPQQQTVHPAITEWVAANKWFDTDPELRKEAEMIGAGLALKDQETAKNNPRALLDQITERIKKLYPEKFQTQKREPSNKVENSTTKSKPTNVAGTKLELQWGDLSEDQQRIGRNIINSGVLNDKAKKNNISPREQYLLDMQATLRHA